MANVDGAQRRARPLSPHLSIYRPIVTMVMSIMHRMTGIMNIGGLVLVIAYLTAIAMGPEAFNTMSGLYGSWVGRVILVAFTWSMIHHMLGGLRHFLWDTGHGFGEVRYTLSQMTLVGSILLTVIMWTLIVLVEVF